MYQGSGGQVSRIGFDPKLPEFYSVVAPSHGVGFANYRAIASDPYALLSLKNSFEMTAISMATSYVLRSESEAMTLGQRGGVMRDGRVQQIEMPKPGFEPGLPP